MSTTTSLKGLENWDVSSATNMSNMFADSVKLEDASQINDWDVTKVTDFTNMFLNSTVYPVFSKVDGTWENGTFIKIN